MGAHVGYEDDAQEQIQPLPILVLHLLRPLLAMAVLLEVLLPLRFVLGIWDPRVCFFLNTKGRATHNQDINL